jgi:sodium-dependent dicarboxylate transporter 2/3/5
MGEDHEGRTYKTFTEVKGTLTPQEERFERWRNTSGLFLGPIVAIALYSTPMPSISQKAHVLTAIIGWVVVWWQSPYPSR